MWSVVVLPWDLSSTGRSTKSLPSQAGKGVRRSRRSLCRIDDHIQPCAVRDGQRAARSPPPPGGSRCRAIRRRWADRACTISPASLTRLSVRGLNSSVPARAKAVTISGEAMKLWVPWLPSLRPEKLRLKELMMLFCSPCWTSVRRHWPMHAPQALARRWRPWPPSAPNWPSRSTVARICSEPGLMRNCTLDLRPLASRLSGHAGRPAHVLVGGIGATAHQRRGQLDRIALLRHFGGQLRDGAVQVG